MTIKRGLIATRPWMQVHSRELGRRLFETTTFISDIKGCEKPDVMDAFYEFYNSSHPTDLRECSFFEVAEVIRRDRMLRNIDRHRAERVVWAMTRALTVIFDRASPDYVVGICLDNYISDLTERITRKQRIPGIFPLASSLNALCRITRRGEHVWIRDPSDAEIDEHVAIVSQPRFVPEWMNKHRSTFDLAKLKAKELAKLAYFPTRRFIDRNPLSFHHRSLFGRADWLSPLDAGWRPSRYFDVDWRERVSTSKKPRVFFPLQWAPETSLDYQVDELEFIDYFRTVERVLSILSRDFTVLVKEHPAVYGYRRTEFYEMIRRYESVVFVPVQVPVQDVFRVTDVVTAYAGSTTGFEARFRDLPVVCLAAPYWALPGEVSVVGSWDRLELLPQMLRDARGPCDRRALMKHVLSNTVPGRYEFVYMDRNNPQHVADVDHVATSFRRYLWGATEPSEIRSPLPARA